LADVYKTKHNDNQCKSLHEKNYKHVHKSHVSRFPPVYNHRRRHFISVTLTIILPSPRGQKAELTRVGGWLHTWMVYTPQAVTHSSIHPTKRRLSTLIETNASTY